MNENHLWNRAKRVSIQTSPDIKGNFDVGFDGEIPEETKAELLRFVAWVESRFNLPVTLWVDFEYKHYLLNRNGKRVGYLFYWADFSTYPVFENEEDIPSIRLPVRTERYTMEEILTSFIEAITRYFAWICNVIHENDILDEDEVEEILQCYLQSREERLS